MACLVAGQKMPAVGRVAHRPVIQVRALLRVRGLGRVARVEADQDDVELLAGRERQHLERRRDAVQHLRAQHRALVVHERQHDRPLPEVIAERHVAARLVLEPHVERQSIAQPLFERHVLELRRDVRRDDAAGEAHGAGHARLLLRAYARKPINAQCPMPNAQRRDQRTQPQHSLGIEH